MSYFVFWAEASEARLAPGDAPPPTTSSSPERGAKKGAGVCVFPYASIRLGVCAYVHSLCYVILSRPQLLSHTQQACWGSSQPPPTLPTSFLSSSIPRSSTSCLPLIELSRSGWRICRARSSEAVVSEWPEREISRITRLDLRRGGQTQTDAPQNTPLIIFPATFYSLLFDVILCKLKLNQSWNGHSSESCKQEEEGRTRDLILFVSKRAPGGVFAPRPRLY